MAEGDTEEIHPSDGDAVEYFFASDASAIIEHTNRVLFLEDDDVAAVNGGVLSIHRINRSELVQDHHDICWVFYIANLNVGQLCVFRN